MIEVKDAKESYRLDYRYLRRLRLVAGRSGKQGVLVIKFPDLLLECRILPLKSYGKIRDEK